ncbi:alpha-amylase family glycosyl hydrolase (plasmid) [Paracoccus sp. TK19116]|uniref:Alpha-amylase family glycosyl hydrolase n=1 Tax=Paracoccus albicereus TaxID=2922394 RepID=A0ABT1MLX7_9RHOB|nr:alpha-amylase family glycosyl hydrolase [Paracoccus albicereus]MCQ0969297.1 alpha-amylase family glycosyl hydrolase [Paracoccus albicereus]
MTQGSDWWKGAVIYQIYPRSYQDTTGDGVGDLPGITRRLDHVADLGADAIWVSPFFRSPMKDYGYDVSDYRDVDPMFGTISDFDALVARAHDLGLKVLIDLVLSHTSDQHPWFAESRASRDNARADWYVWADPKPDGTAPTNWLSIFGGPAWQWDARREQYYLHNFLTAQPDLNFHNPDVQQALLDVARFWLERGVDGFRLDTINFYFHDAQLRDNPPLPPAERRSDTAPAVNPYNHQSHRFDKSQPENLPFLEQLRALMDQYGAAAVGEIGDSERALELLEEYTAGSKRMHMSYVFDFLSGEDLGASRVAEVFEALEAEAPNAWPCWAFSNHDVVRHVSRWNLWDQAARAYATLLMCLRGSVCLYQGEELALPEADIAFEDLRDPYGIEFWPEFKGRDGCRTPMVWDGSATGGFTDGKPWLPVPPEHIARNVEAMAAEQGSILHHYRQAVALRKAHPALRTGSIHEMRADGSVLHFVREDGDARVTIDANLSDAPAGALAPWEVRVTEG